MRRNLIGLAVVAVLVLAGCGDDDSTTAGTDGATTTTTSGGDTGTTAKAGGDGSADAFCRDFKDVDQEFSDVDLSDAKALEQVADALRELDPPAEIEDDFKAFVDGLDTLKGTDLSDPEAVAAVRDELTKIEAASGRLERYISDTCDLD